MQVDDVQILFADLQPEIVARSKTVPPASLAASAAVLAKVGAILGLPLHFSVVPEGGQPPALIPALTGFANEGNTHPRMTADPFLDERTVAALSATGRRTLVIAGFAVEVVSLHAATSALARGLAVQLPIDANGGMSERSERAALRQLEAAGGVATSVVTLATALAPDFSRSPGQDVFAALQALRLA